MTIQVKATAIEQNNQHSASTIKNIAIKMLDGQACVNPWQLVNGFVSTWINQIPSVSLTVKAQCAKYWIKRPPIPVRNIPVIPIS